MNTYDWAANPQKLARAIGMGGDETAIKANYIKIGGLLTPEYQETPVEVPEEIVVMTEEPEYPDARVHPKKAVKKVGKKK